MALRAWNFLGFSALWLATIASASGQTGSTLTLNEALRLAKDRNGDIRAAVFNVKAADSSVIEAMSAFFPTITPIYQYNSSRQQLTGGALGTFIQTEGSSTQINANLTLLDSGERGYAVGASRRALDAQRSTTRETLRQTLFNVLQQYVETLRSQELLRVADSQVDRANKILEQTQTRVELRDAARMDILQAKADALNARVTALVQRNTATNAQAALKALIGLPSDQPLPTLEKTQEPTTFSLPGTLDQLTDEGIRSRPDLIAMRKTIESLRFNELIAQHQAGLSFSLGLTYDQQVTPTWLQDRTLLFTLSGPFFDGGKSRAAARQIAYNIQSNKATLVQQERIVRSQIESAFKQLSQNAERVQAAQSALEAAKENYASQVESQRLGASDLISVLTAQVSLVTAESNYVEAVYDYTISGAQLNLVTGRPIPGE